jgi:hypothetical protein
MPVIRFLLPVLLFTALANAQEGVWDPLADAREFKPGLFRAWSKNTVRILETYQHYQEAVVEHRPKRYDSLSHALVEREKRWFFFFEADQFSPVLRNSSGSFTRLMARTDRGNLEVDVVKSMGAAHVGYRSRHWETGTYAIADWLELRAERQYNGMHPELFENSDGADFLSLKAGYTLLAGYYRWKDWSLDAGLLMHFVPLVTSDSMGQETFRLRQMRDSSYSGEESSESIFIALGKSGYAFNTLLSADEGLASLGFDFPTISWNELDLTPFLRYQNYRTRYQAGGEVRISFFDPHAIRLEAAGDIHRNAANRFEAFGHVVIGQTWTFLALSPEQLASYDRYDFKIRLHADASLSSDALDESIWGAAGAVTFEDIAGVASFRIGMGYNALNQLRNFPERDAVGIQLLLRLAW